MNGSAINCFGEDQAGRMRAMSIAATGRSISAIVIKGGRRGGNQAERPPSGKLFLLGRRAFDNRAKTCIEDFELTKWML
jgi:hypothetical protein